MCQGHARSINYRFNSCFINEEMNKKQITHRIHRVSKSRRFFISKQPFDWLRRQNPIGR